MAKFNFNTMRRSTPMRLSLGLVLLFAVMSVISYSVAFLILRYDLSDNMRQSLLDEMEGYATAQSATELQDLVSAKARLSEADQELISLVTEDGRYFGNAHLHALKNGFSIIEDREHHPLEGDSYLILTQKLPSGVVTIGRSRSQIIELGEFFINVFFLSLIPTLIITIVGGIYLAGRSSNRLAQIGDTLDQIAEGDLSARVPEARSGQSDLDNIAERVDLMASAQQASVSALKQVSADIAHDLKTPIQRVSVLLNQARENIHNPKKAEGYLTKAEDETKGIILTFQSLLQIAQIEGGSPKARFEPVDLGKIAGTIFDVYEPSAEETGHVLELKKASDPYWVMGDKSLLSQVLANLVENALRHTASGTKIVIKLKNSMGKTIVSVADHGTGIPEHERENVLRRLYRLEASRTTPGNGLGLALVSVIANLHDASLELSDNAPGLRVELRFATLS